MNRIANKRMIGLAVSTAMAAGLLNGCVTHPAPRADLSASRAETALAKGKTESAIEHAEAATLAEPRNAAYRVTLGTAYLDAGRFASAATTFGDAMKLGDSSPRTVLSLALALDGEGRYQQAAALLRERESQIAPADLGLAYALSGETGQGIQVLSNAIRGGENTPKMRQNLAYAYALAGRWKEARLMAAQDVPANLVGDRMEEWSRMAQPQAWQARVAALLGAPAGVVDAGQPVQLALANHPGVEQLASEAAANAAPEAHLALNAPPATQELPATDDDTPQLAVASAPAPTAPEPSTFQAAFASVAEAAQDALRFVSQPVVQALPSRHKAARQAEAPVERANGTHLVQLGSFSSEQSARRAWSVYAKRYPGLAGHQMVLTEAVVRGKHYWRVSAAGFGPVTSHAMCGRVKSAGEGCFAYAEGRPLPGAVESGTRLALR